MHLRGGGEHVDAQQRMHCNAVEGQSWDLFSFSSPPSWECVLLELQLSSNPSLPEQNKQDLHHTTMTSKCEMLDNCGTRWEYRPLCD